MTEKELLYLEDATNHEQSIIEICKDISKRLKDSKLIDYIDKEIKIHNDQYKRMMKLLEGESK